MKVLTLLILVNLCAFVRCEIFQCQELYNRNSCWNPKTYDRDEKCWECSLYDLTVNTSLITLNGRDDSDVKKTPVNLGFVYFVGGNFTKMPVIAQQHFDSPVTQVRLTETNIKVINAEFFANNRHLRTLGIAYNEGLSVEGLAFQNCSSLVSLSFYRNNLGRIPLDTFHGMQQLIKLTLYNEKLTVIEPVWFQDLKNLKILHLFYNYFQEIPEKAFDSLPELEQLNLNDNKIESISQRMFQHNDKLKKLEINQNQIKKIQVNSFQHLNQLTELDLARNVCIKKKFVNKISTVIAKGLTSCYPITCVVPNITNGFVIKTEDNSTISPGDLIDELTPVKVRCDSTFLLFHDKANQTENSCLASGWQDEEWPKCQRKCPYNEITGPTITSDCELNGVEFPCSGQLLTGTIATIRCQLGHVKPKDVQQDLTCLESGEWNHAAFKCVPANDKVNSTALETKTTKCPLSDISGPSITSNCEYDDEDFLCANGDLLPGTKAEIRCRFGYLKPTNALNSKLTCQESGNWSHVAFKCEAVCGKVARHSVPLQIGGKITNSTEVPWHVGIYKESEQICGGTIISERLVISAAHCFSEAINQIHIVDYEKYQVAAGKILRELNATETQETQIRGVQNVTFSLKYDGNQKWYADIVVVTIRGHFEYRLHIAPACVEFCIAEEEKYPKNGTLALVAGWGLNEEFKSSETLLTFDIPVLDWKTCEESAPEDFKEKVVEDKICAGYVNSDSAYAKVVCRGDSGGGLVIPQVKNDKKIYYLQGVVSNSQSTVNCDTSFVALFTNVQEFKNMINGAIKKTPFEEN